MTALILDPRKESASFMHRLQETAARVQLWMDRHEQRRQLAQLPAHLLQDMGLDSERVAEELRKPFWK